MSLATFGPDENEEIGSPNQMVPYTEQDKTVKYLDYIRHFRKESGWKRTHIF